MLSLANPANCQVTAEIRVLDQTGDWRVLDSGVASCDEWPAPRWIGKAELEKEGPRAGDARAAAEAVPPHACGAPPGASVGVGGAEGGGRRAEERGREGLG